MCVCDAESKMRNRVSPQNGCQTVTEEGGDGSINMNLPHACSNCQRVFWVMNHSQTDIQAN